MSNYPGALSGGFVSHRFVSLKPDQPDLSVVNPTNWNQSHIIGSGAIQSGALGASMVNSGNVSANAIISGSIASGAVVYGTLASGAVSSGNLATNSVVSGDLASGAVTYGTLASGVITSGLVASGAVQWVQLLNTSKPFVVVTQSGPSDGGDFGPGTAGTTTAGIQEALKSLTASRTWQEGVRAIGKLTVASPIQVPSYSILDLSAAQIIDNNTTKLPTLYGATFYNSGLTTPAYDSDSHITIIGGIVQPAPNNLAFRFAGITNLKLINNFVSLTSGYGGFGGSACKNVWIENMSVIGSSGVNISGFNYGIEFPDPENFGSNSLNIWIVNPRLENITGDNLVFNAVDGLWCFNPYMTTVGNTQNSNKNDICIDVEWNANKSVASQNIHIVNPIFDKSSSGIPNYAIWLGADGTKLLNNIEIAGAIFKRSTTPAQAQSAIYLGGTLKNIDIHDCIFTEGAAGIQISNNTANGVGTIIGCKIHDNTFQSGANSINFPQAGYSRETDIYNNAFLNLQSGVGGQLTYVPILINASGQLTGSVRVFNNKYDNTGATWAAGLGTISSGFQDFQSWNNYNYNNALAASGITVGASPFSYANADGYPEVLVVQGGTVSEIDIVRNGTTINTGVTAGVFLLEPKASGDVLKVTYSVAPSINKIPM